MFRNCLKYGTLMLVFQTLCYAFYIDKLKGWIDMSMSSNWVIGD